MQTEPITINVSSDVARQYAAASDENKRKIELLVSLKLSDALRSQRPLEEIMSEMSRTAQQRGLTEESLQSILDERLAALCVRHQHDH
jgi:hypothetical protein